MSAAPLWMYDEFSIHLTGRPSREVTQTLRRVRPVEPGTHRRPRGVHRHQCPLREHDRTDDDEQQRQPDHFDVGH